ncbi:hypothetical protein KP696_21895 [Nocardia seriolae]|nr:hypothetical protein [Nocardia seriolae]MTJ61349.1 hypothetical protein [Nocardia seriolae]MTJ71761.1 hypothetical protein [Nocardia seriolae]MTJ90527.1 hypothetical protein [Nocardia seriolae]MTK34487.1 hypothetical protein [Nocardia seriolae]MTK39325.1 hypothetical protein [Nocardia seriolae]
MVIRRSRAQYVLMIAECPSCAWPSPTVVSSHRSVQYLRCVCGQWLISVHGKVVGAAGGTTFSGKNPVAEIAGIRD